MRTRYISIIPAILCLAQFALAQTDTFTITGANPNGYYLGNNPAVYVDPYTATIKNGAKTIYGPSGLVICDDFTDDVTVPETWNVEASTVTSSGAADGLFEGVTSYSLGIVPVYSGAQGYNMVAYLASQLMTQYNNQVDSDALSYAIWTIFTPAAYSNIAGDMVNGVSIQTAVKADIIAAYDNTSGGTDYSGPTVTVWRPTSWTGDPSRPQEFLTVQTPEASALASLAVDFTVVLGVLFVLRRHILRGRRAT